MALHHLESGEIANLRHLGGDALSTQSIALFKSEQLEVIRLMLPRGRSMPMHQVAGEITVQCLEGAIDFETPDGVQRLQAGQLLFLRGGAAQPARGGRRQRAGHHRPGGGGAALRP